MSGRRQVADVLRGVFRRHLVVWGHLAPILLSGCSVVGHGDQHASSAGITATFP